MCLCASEVLLWQSAGGIFARSMTLTNSYEHSSSTYNFYGSDEVGGVYMILTYITIYFVKLSFLFFFRILARRDRKMTVYWWTVLAIIIITLLVSIVIVVVPLCQIFQIHNGMF